MEVKNIYDYFSGLTIELSTNVHIKGNVLQYAMLASEKDPFDAMEKAIWQAYQEHSEKNLHEHSPIIFEYPLEGHPPIMTHVYDGINEKIVAAKGATERIIKICKLDKEEAGKISNKVRLLASKGYRVIGVASSKYIDKILPESQDEFDWKFVRLT
jgi:Ca2+-transporting ATPase